FPPQGGYPYAPTAQPPQRKKHILRNVIIIASILVIIFVACAGLLVFAVKQQIDKSQSFVVTQIAGNKTKVAQTRVNATQVVQTVVAGTTTAVAANPNPYLSGQGTFLVQDKLDGSDTPSPLLKGPAGEYRDGAFHIVSVVKDMIVSCPLINTPEPDGSRVLYPQYKNFTAEFKMTIVQGDTGGIHFRISGRQAYRLIFDSMGRYQLNADQGGKLTSLSHGASAAFHQGLNQENTIGLAVDGHSILWFVNGQPVGAVNDSTFGDAGGISLEAGSYVGHTYATEVAFRDFRLWALNS
ncbi:MAG TPA: hypothetical protein VKX46_12815, partial [Ktedonobacteraceae bacterium]|nr:hypothetical protein [Ktedonobacteraceae bacterium]